MLKTPNNRNYVRTGQWAVSALVSKEDDEQWSEATVLDIAAGGLLFLAETTYETGDLLHFDLKIDPMTPGIARKIPVVAKGEITGNRGTREGKCAYSVKFTDISKGDRIRIDELVRMTNYKYKLDAGLDMLDV